MPKLLGGWVLHRLFEDTRLDFFVLFSSWAGLLGPVGQRMAGYSAANAFLDSLAHHRNALGQAALSIDWGDWAEVGMRARYAREGHRLLPDAWTLKPEQGLRSLEDSLARQGSAQVAILPVKWQQFFQIFPQTRKQPYLSDIAGDASEGITDQEQSRRRMEFLSRLEHLPVAARLDFLISHVQSQVAEVLGVSPAESLDPQRGLFEVGMDSLMALQLKNQLECSIGRSIPIIATVEHPTIQALSEYLARDVFGVEVPRVASEAPSDRYSSKAEDPLSSIEQLSDDEVDTLVHAANASKGDVAQ